MTSTLYVMIDPYVAVNGVDLSDYVAAAYWEERVEIRDITAPDSPARIRQGGLRDGQVTIDWAVSYDPAGPFRVLHPLLGGTVPVEVRPKRGHARTTNPRHTADCVIAHVPVLGGARGELMQEQTIWPFSGLPSYAAAWFDTVLTVGERGALRGWSDGTSTESATAYGSVADASFDLPDGTAITLSGVEFNTTHGWAAVYLPDNATAQALQGWVVEAPPLEVILDTDPGTDTFYRQQRVSDPGWAAGAEVTLSVWQPS